MERRGDLVELELPDSPRSMRVLRPTILAKRKVQSENDSAKILRPLGRSPSRGLTRSCPREHPSAEGVGEQLLLYSTSAWMRAIRSSCETALVVAQVAPPPVVQDAEQVCAEHVRDGGVDLEVVAAHRGVEGRAEERVGLVEVATYSVTQ